jgi:arylsulfatase
MVVADLPLAPLTTRRPYLHPSVPVRPIHRDWNQLSPTSKLIEAQPMEIYAAMVDELDSQIGRLIRELKDLNEYDDSLIIVMSDNGAAPSEVSGSGYGPDWARACSGPFRLVKGYPTEGGIRCPCIIKVPGKKEHKISDEFASVLDLVPTFCELAHIDYPSRHREKEILPLQGASMLPYLESRRDTIHAADYGMGWELFGRAAFRRSDWKIVSIEPPFGKGPFELFNIQRDPGEAEDLSMSQPEVYREMVRGWEKYANQVQLLMSRPVAAAH